MFLAAFLPLFVALNVPGILPIFMAFTDGASDATRKSLAWQAVLAALGLAVAIVFAGKVIFSTLGITLNDLRVGGGLVLLVLSISDLIFGDYRRRDPGEGATVDNTSGIVPLGIPLVMGPASITTLLVLEEGFSYMMTLSVLVANLTLILVLFLYGPAVMKVVGKGATTAIAKVSTLFLAAIAVAMIKSGVFGMIAGG